MPGWAVSPRPQGWRPGSGPPLPQGRAWTTVPALPHRAPGHISINFWDTLRYKPRFFCSLPHAAAPDKNLVTLTPAACRLAFPT